jgi:hypothetical protein
MDYTSESFERGPELSRSASALPAASYNLSRILLVQSRTGCVFVPMRGMQYMAVIDAEEIIFVDSQYKRWVEVAWRGFRPDQRQALDEAVAYQVVFYTPDGADTHRRLQGEFHAAMTLLDSRRPHPTTANVLAMPKR